MYTLMILDEYSFVYTVQIWIQNALIDLIEPAFKNMVIVSISEESAAVIGDKFVQKCW